MNESKTTSPWLSVIITLLLCIFKLTGVISISWWWCLCLIWLPVALIFAILSIFFIILIVVIIIGLIVELIDVFKR